MGANASSETRKGLQSSDLRVLQNVLAGNGELRRFLNMTSEMVKLLLKQTDFDCRPLGLIAV